MLPRFRKSLSEHGFQPIAPGVLARDAAAAVRQMIWQQRSRVSPGSVNLLVAIGVHDAHLAPPAYQTVLVGHVNARQTAISDFEAADAWSPADEAAAREALFTHGLRWLEEFAQPARLIAHFERILEEGITSAGAPPRRPPVYHLYLSLLYGATGDHARACMHCNCWLGIVSRSRHPGEPDRTRRHLAELGCDSGIGKPRDR